MDYQQGKSPWGVGAGRGAGPGVLRHKGGQVRRGRAVPGSRAHAASGGGCGWSPDSCQTWPAGKKSNINWFLLPDLHEEDERTGRETGGAKRTVGSQAQAKQ